MVGVVVLALAAVTAIVVAILLTRDEAVRPVSQEAQGPVLLVPGYGGGTAGLQVLADSLRALGREVTVVDLPGNNTGDLDRQARELDKTVVLTMQRAGARSVDVVGYSAGGVVARLWVRDHGGGNLARRVVTLGSPHHGSDLAGIGSDVTPDSCPEACRQLQPDSDLLRRLNAGDETPEGPLWISIWTTDDRIVPPSSSELEGALGFAVQSVCPGARVSHGQLPQDRIVTALVIRQLALVDPAVPGPAICTAPG